MEQVLLPVENGFHRKENGIGEVEVKNWDEKNAGTRTFTDKHGPTRTLCLECFCGAYFSGGTFNAVAGVWG